MQLDELVPRFVAGAIERLHPAVRSWIDDAAAHVYFRGPLGDALRRVHDLPWATRWRASCEVPASRPEDYLSRMVSLRSGGVALLEVRFKGLDPAWPFLELAALDGPVDTACLEELIEEARRHPLAPRALRVEVAGQLPSERSASADLRIIVGHTRDLVARPAPSTPLRLEQARDTSGYARYAEAFRAFVAADARVGPELWLPDEATFRELVDGGHAYDAHVDGQWAGFIAARAETFIGNDGWIVHEELLDAPFRGRGLAPALQRALVERLHEGRPGLVHGTIHFKNAASLATAKRVGRIDVGGYFFLELT